MKIGTLLEFGVHRLGDWCMCGKLNQKIRERVQDKLSRFKCQEELLKYVVGLERDIHFLRIELGNLQVRSGKSLQRIVRSYNN